MLSLFEEIPLRSLRINATVIIYVGIVPKYCVQQSERLPWSAAHLAKYITVPAGNNIYVRAASRGLTSLESSIIATLFVQLLI